MRLIISIALVVLILGIHVSGQSASSGAVGKNVVATNKCYPKGGLGIVRKDLCIDLKSPVNRLLLDAGKSWSGKGRNDPELVIFFQGQVWPAQSTDGGFDLSKSIIVSFEGEEIRFFNFANSSGGYYKREPAN
ncbi:MAG: hypothetical protein ACLQHF_02510 [Terracidiphilus sp.]